MIAPDPQKSSQPCHYSGVDTKSNSDRTSNRNGDHKSIRSPIITRNSIRGGSSHSNSRVNSLARNYRIGYLVTARNKAYVSYSLNSKGWNIVDYQEDCYSAY